MASNYTQMGGIPTGYGDLLNSAQQQLVLDGTNAKAATYTSTVTVTLSSGP